MIRIVQGNPGSGKSYYACSYLEKFSTYDPLYGAYTLNDGVVIITNIDNLKLSHINFDEQIEKYTIEKFLTVANFEILIQKYKARHVILIIDEAQKYLDSKFYDKDVFFFFQYHRHLGLDIFLLTQSVTTVCRQLIPLCEFIIEACPRSKGLYGTMRYKFKDVKGTFMYSKAVRKKKELFAMYTSFNSDEAEKPKNVLSHWIITAAVVIAVVSFGFKGFFYAYAHKSEKSRTISVAGSRPIQKPLSSSHGIYYPAPSMPPVRSVAPISRPARVAAPQKAFTPPVVKTAVTPDKVSAVPAVPTVPKMFYKWVIDGQMMISNVKPVVPDGVTVVASIVD